MQISWCMLLIWNTTTDTIFTGTSLFLPWLLSFWQLWYATVTHTYSETSYTKSVVPHNLQKISLLEMNPEVHQKFSQNSNLVPVSYSSMRVEEVRVCHLPCTNSGLKQRILIDSKAKKGDESELPLLSRILQHREETREIPWTLDGKCAVLIYMSVNSMFHKILEKNCGDLSANPLSSESCVNALVLSRGV
jgi:hypothetical protein